MPKPHSGPRATPTSYRFCAATCEASNPRGSPAHHLGSTRADDPPQPKGADGERQRDIAPIGKLDLPSAREAPAELENGRDQQKDEQGIDERHQRIQGESLRRLTVRQPDEPAGEAAAQAV